MKYHLNHIWSKKAAYFRSQYAVRSATGKRRGPSGAEDGFLSGENLTKWWEYLWKSKILCIEYIYIYHKMIIRVYYIISHDTVDACEILHQFVDGLSPYNPISQQVRPFVRVFLLFSLHRICADTLMVIIFIKNLFLLVKMDRHFYIWGNMRVWHHARKSLVTNNHMNWTHKNDAENKYFFVQQGW